MKFRLIEAVNEWIDPDDGKEYSDAYKTGYIKDAPNDVIDTTITGVTWYDQLIPGDSENEYMRKYKNLVGDIVYMTPDEYIQKCAQMFSEHGDHQVSSGDLIRQRSYDTESNDTIEKVITKFHRQIPMPYLHESDNAQEGLHRMRVLKMLFGNNVKYPVLVVRYADEERAKREAQEKYEYEVRSSLRRAISNSVRYSYSDFSEFLEQLQYDINHEFRYWDEFESEDDVPFEYTVDVDKINITILGITEEVDIDAIQINEEDSDDELDLDDLSDDYLLDDIDMEFFK